MSRLYLVEDEAVIRDALRRMLERNGYEVHEAESVEAARGDPALRAADLVIADLRLPGAPGTDLLGIGLAAPVLVMTSYASVPSAVEAMKLGAADYVEKPFDHDELLLTVSRLLAARGGGSRGGSGTGAVGGHGLIGESPPMREAIALIERIAPTGATVLITGESGTGKELAARALHDFGPRPHGPWIPVNCAAIPGDLIESELFGHERGAFTGAVSRHDGLVAAADGGTLFLDEVGELARDSQARLLRVIEDGEVRRVGSNRPRKVDVRVVAATHRDLRELVAAGSFREDFYFRLNVIELALPALRERGDDVAVLARAFVERGCRRLARAPVRLRNDACDALLRHHWPGNVRELEHAVERALILCDGDEITPELLGPAGAPPGTADAAPARTRAEDAAPARAEDPAPAHGHPEAPPPPPADPPGAAPAQVSDLSLDAHFRHVVETWQERLTETELAQRLGVSRKTLWERRRRLGLPRPGRRPR